MALQLDLPQIATIFLVLGVFVWAVIWLLRRRW